MIRHRVLRALAANRDPGFHFTGNFCEVSFHPASVTMDAGPHNTDRHGQVDFAILAMVADMALAGAIRRELSMRTRLATVSMSLQLTGAPAQGPVEASGVFDGFLGEGEGRQGLSRTAMTSGGVPIAFGHGAFMPLEAPPGVKLFPMPGPEREWPGALDEGELEDHEREVLAHADRVLANPEAEGDFMRHFLGFFPRASGNGATATLRNGMHIANRVGHVQGGLLAGFACATAVAALPETWKLSGMTACFVSPGQGEALDAVATVRHRGMVTAVVHTEITGPRGRRVLEAVTTHARSVAVKA
jgi:acyl-coenzyme A thioesterase PaaI-like protein